MNRYGSERKPVAGDISETGSFPQRMLIAGPNLTVDRTLAIDELRPGEVLRFDDVAVTPGGKGVNVARVARALKTPAVVVGFSVQVSGARSV